VCFRRPRPDPPAPLPPQLADERFAAARAAARAAAEKAAASLLGAAGGALSALAAAPGTAAGDVEAELRRWAGRWEAGGAGLGARLNRPGLGPTAGPHGTRGRDRRLRSRQPSRPPAPHANHAPHAPPPAPQPPSVVADYDAKVAGPPGKFKPAVDFLLGPGLAALGAVAGRVAEERDAARRRAADADKRAAQVRADGAGAAPWVGAMHAWQRALALPVKDASLTGHPRPRPPPTALAAQGRRRPRGRGRGRGGVAARRAGRGARRGRGGGERRAGPGSAPDRTGV
jgi:hypothetical protein